jgi:hypothetical protein
MRSFSRAWCAGSRCSDWGGGSAAEPNGEQGSSGWGVGARRPSEGRHREEMTKPTDRWQVEDSGQRRETVTVMNASRGSLYSARHLTWNRSRVSGAFARPLPFPSTRAGADPDPEPNSPAADRKSGISAAVEIPAPDRLSATLSRFLHTAPHRAARAAPDRADSDSPHTTTIRLADLTCFTNPHNSACTSSGTSANDVDEGG